MAVKLEAITSREYKLILFPDRFADRDAGCDGLREVIGRLAHNCGGEMKSQREVEERRTRYLDTPDHRLNAAGYALRVRYESSDDAWKTTLKHRSPDFLVAAAKNLAPTEKAAKSKFEEDILPSFRSLFSKSAAVVQKKPPKLEVFGDLVGSFAGIGELELPADRPLETVNGFEAREVFVKLCKLSFGGKPKVKLGLSFWYLSKISRWPLIAECAYDYDLEGLGTKRGARLAESTGRLFAGLQKQPGWFNEKATTKTRYVYDGLG